MLHYIIVICIYSILAGYTNITIYFLMLSYNINNIIGKLYAWNLSNFAVGKQWNCFQCYWRGHKCELAAEQNYTYLSSRHVDIICNY